MMSGIRTRLVVTMPTTMSEPCWRRTTLEDPSSKALPSMCTSLKWVRLVSLSPRPNFPALPDVLHHQQVAAIHPEMRKVRSG